MLIISSLLSEKEREKERERESETCLFREHLHAEEPLCQRNLILFSFCQPALIRSFSFFSFSLNRQLINTERRRQLATRSPTDICPRGTEHVGRIFAILFSSINNICTDSTVPAERETDARACSKRKKTNRKSEKNLFLDRLWLNMAARRMYYWWKWSAHSSCFCLAADMER